MAIKNFRLIDRENDIMILKNIIISFIIIAWLLTPPGNKFVQLCFWGHNVQYAVTRIFDKNATEEYKFYWKNAIYLAKMNDKKALTMMDKAIEAIPTYFTEKQVRVMYLERAKIRCMLKDYKGSLNDYLRVGNLSNEDVLRVAFMLKSQEKSTLALSYCNKLLDLEFGFSSGCACIADVYADAGKVDYSVRVYDYLINRDPNVPEHYIARSKYKKMLGDKVGERNDIYIAKLKNPDVDENYSPITDILLAKNIELLNAF